MASLQADTISNAAGAGAPTFPFGLISTLFAQFNGGVANIGSIVATDTNQTVAQAGAHTITYTGFTTTRTVTLPSANVVAGEMFMLCNSQPFDMQVFIGASQLTVANSCNIDATVRSGYVLLQALTTTPTTAANWRVLDLYEVGSYSGISGSFTSGTYYYARSNKTVSFNMAGGWSSGGGATSASGFVVTRLLPAAEYNWAAGGNTGVNGAVLFRNTVSTAGVLSISSYLTSSTASSPTANTTNVDGAGSGTGGAYTTL